MYVNEGNCKCQLKNGVGWQAKTKQMEETINCVADLLKWVKKCHNETTSDSIQSTSLIYYRGHSDRSWDLLPGVFRENIDEKELLRQAQRIAWTELSEYDSYLEKLITLQHYGLLTRLLDVTTNPLVALYFACESNEGEDGIIYWGRIPATDSNIAAELIAKFLFTSNEHSNCICTDKFKKDYFINSIDSLQKCHFIEAPHNNSRIIAQSGAFIVPPLFEKNQDEKHLKLTQKKATIEAMFEKSHVMIPANRKGSLLSELYEMGINKGTIYPDLQHKLKTINTYCQKTKATERIDY